MTAAHFFIESVGADVVRIAGSDAHHAARALRIREGEEITVSDGRGTIARARCAAVSAVEVLADVIARDFVEQPSPRLIVFPAVPKAGKLETIVQKLTEIGVDEIRPWFASRSVARWDERKAASRTARMQTIAKEAAMQSRRAWLPIVAAPAPLHDLPDPCFVLHEEGESRLGEALQAVVARTVGVIVGPEGGLDHSEIEHVSGIGGTVVSLGRQVLRTETAALVGPVLVLAHFKRLG